MGEAVPISVDHIGFFLRKKRSQTSRRPRRDSHSSSKNHDQLPFSSPPVAKDSSPDFSRVSCTSRDGDENPHKKIKRGNGRFSSVYVNELGRNGLNKKRSTEGVLAPTNRTTSKVTDHLESESGITNSHVERKGEAQNLGLGSKVKLRVKVGGAYQTNHGNSKCSNLLEDGSSSRKSPSSDATGPRQKLILQVNSDDDDEFPSDNKRGLEGIPGKDFSMGKNPRKSDFPNQGDKHESTRKSKRVPKKQKIDDDDDEIRYLEKLKTFKRNGSFKDEDERPVKTMKLSCISGVATANGNVENGRSYDEEGEAVLECDLKEEISMTTRQRALHLGKGASSAHGANLEFPNGLPPVPSKRQKEKLSEVEQQLKKTEAAQKRKAYNEKVARESEAEAIRKILGQESTRKKREDKIKKRNEELAQEKAAKALVVPPNTVRSVMGPAGTIVTFSSDMGLPSIFNSKPCSYPPPRENCAGPSCTNSYKYRDSKSKLPLCSLQCYKAVQEKIMYTPS